MRITDRAWAGCDIGSTGLGTDAITTAVFENLPAGLEAAQVGALTDDEAVAC